MADTTFIYELIDPRTGQTRYVGKTDYPEKRLGQHLIDRTNEYKWKWINELTELSLSPTLLVLAEVPYEEWAIQESYWIHDRKEQGCDLLNILKGEYPRTSSTIWVRKINIAPHALQSIFLEKGLKSKSQIAKSIGVSMKKVNEILDGQKLDQITIIKLARFLGVEPESLIAVHPTN